MSERPKHICLIAGEASGDALGERLMTALRARVPDIVFSGVGGALMEEQGLHSLFPMERLSVMGIAEVLPRLPDILRRIRETANHIVKTQPDIVVTIDAPDFVFRVVRKVRQHGGKLPKFVHYVAPSVWAWREERAKKLATLYDGVLCLLPFEPPYFEREGMRAAFVGHPLLEQQAAVGYRDAMRNHLQLPPHGKLMGIFLGSRIGELKHTGPVLLAAAAQLAKQHPGVHFLLPTLPHLEGRVTAMVRGAPFPWKVVVAGDNKPDIFAALDAAMATSGTVGLELALANVPHVIGYRLNRVTYELVRRKIRVKYAHLVNLLLDRPAVPEFLQNDCNAEAIAQAAGLLLHNETARRDQVEAFRRARDMLAGAHAEKPPSAQAADFVLSL